MFLCFFAPLKIMRFSFPTSNHNPTLMHTPIIIMVHALELDSVTIPEAVWEGCHVGFRGQEYVYVV